MKYLYLGKEDDTFVAKSVAVRLDEAVYDPAPDTALLVRLQHTSTANGCTYMVIETAAEFKEASRDHEQALEIKNLKGFTNVTEVKKPDVRPPSRYNHFIVEEKGNESDCDLAFKQEGNCCYSLAKLLCWCAPCWQSTPSYRDEAEEEEQVEMLIKRPGT